MDKYQDEKLLAIANTLDAKIVMLRDEYKKDVEMLKSEIHWLREELKRRPSNKGITIH